MPPEGGSAEAALGLVREYILARSPEAVTAREVSFSVFVVPLMF